MTPLIMFAALIAAAADPTEGSIHVTLEKKDGAEWKGQDPRAVLTAQDRIRFKFESSFGGFLYVYDRGTDGTTEKLFPISGADNRIEPGKTYVVPASGSFVIDGPAGFDVTYWILSPEPLARIPMFDDAAGKGLTTGPSTLIPRCKEGLVARGGSSGCLDERAGPQPSQNPGKVVSKADSTLRARNIRVEKDGEAKISVTPSKQAPIVYEFRVAHK